MNEEKDGLGSLNLSNSITIGQGVTFVGSISARGKAFINGKVTGEMAKTLEAAAESAAKYACTIATMPTPLPYSS